jgi:hypothetical protein
MRRMRGAQRSELCEELGESSSLKKRPGIGVEALVRRLVMPPKSVPILHEEWFEVTNRKLQGLNGVDAEDGPRFLVEWNSSRKRSTRHGYSVSPLTSMTATTTATRSAALEARVRDPRTCMEDRVQDPWRRRSDPAKTYRTGTPTGALQSPPRPWSPHDTAACTSPPTPDEHAATTDTLRPVPARAAATMVLVSARSLSAQWVRVLACAPATMMVLACSSSSSGSPPSGGGACALVFFPPDYPASCQASLDQTCCVQERACASQGACVDLVACINNCPAPRQDSCVSACSTSDNAALDAIADCSKAVPADGGGSASCDWPN